MTELSLAQPTAAPSQQLHQHGWVTQSAHRTSEGTVRYVRCHCGARRIDLQSIAAEPPVALSQSVPGPGRGHDSGACPSP